MATAGGVVSAPTPMPVTILEIVPPFAVTLTFPLTVADMVGPKATVTAWIAPTSTRLNAPPETTLKGAETEAVPETVPPPVFCTANV